MNAGGLLVGPAMGFVGALVRASVTTKVWPSHPFVESRSASLSESARGALGSFPLTICSPGFVLVLHDNLADAGREAMVVIIHHCLSYVLCGLAD